MTQQDAPTREQMRTPLYHRHVDAGAQMVEFGGWMMPLQYTSMRAEHLAVRNAAGIFDVSHMGEFEVSGRGAVAALDRLVTNRVADLENGQARYCLLLNEDGGIVDDLLVYRKSGDDFLVVVNAGPREKDFEHFGRHLAGEDLELSDVSLGTALLAVQGPHAAAVVRSLASIDTGSIPYYHHATGELGGITARFSRTGYTGEDGFEIFVPWDEAGAAWDMLLKRGADHGLVPAGLGARDTLRLEASMRLSGQDIDESTNPLEAGLGWAVKLDKGDFVGRDALLRAKEEGLGRAFIGLELAGRAIARHGYPVLDAGTGAGEVTSGTFSFTLGRAVAMGYVARDSADSQQLAVDVRGEAVPARRAAMPFYRRARG